MTLASRSVPPEAESTLPYRCWATDLVRRRKVSTAATVLVVALIALGGCDRSTGMSPEVRERKVGAYSTACAARELAARALDDEETLAATAAAADPSTPGGQMTLAGATAVLDFARAYSQHAELRAAAYAYVDSAVNRSATPADSARYMQVADRFTIRTPVEGTVEANVMRSFDQKMVEILTNADHPCNWDLPF